MNRRHDFKTVLKIINNNIGFTMEHSNKRPPFLDILVRIVDSKFESDIF